MGKWIEWMCTVCGAKKIRNENVGRPMSGRCSRNNGKPHRWVKNREH